MTSGFALRPVLAALGMPLAFTDEADFSGITTAQRLRIDEVVHQAYIDVNEAGTEAAAATAVVMTASARFMNPEPPVEMIVDRPFLFAHHRPAQRAAAVPRPGHRPHRGLTRPAGAARGRPATGAGRRLCCLRHWGYATRRAAPCLAQRP